MKCLSVLLPSLLFVLAACNQIPSTNISEDEKAIRLRRDYSNNAIARHDTTAMASVWTRDYHLVSSGNIEGGGKNQNRDMMSARFTARPDINFIRSPETIKFYQPWRMAAETGTWIGSWTENGKKINIGGSYYAKWHKLDGTWYIRAEIFTMLHCDGGEFCEKSPI